MRARETMKRLDRLNSSHRDVFAVPARVRTGDARETSVRRDEITIFQNLIRKIVIYC